MNALMENFELILTAAVVVCFVFYLLDSKDRKVRNMLYRVFKRGNETDHDRNLYAARLAFVVDSDRSTRQKRRDIIQSAIKHINHRQPLSSDELYWAKHPVYPREKFREFFGGMFWILFIVWFVRSFLYEPFQIPSASMEPTLQTGDFILTEKFSYGFRLPVTHQKIFDVGAVKRGDVIVFRYPKNPKLNYIKRVVAVPGDHVRIKEGRLWVNGQAFSLNIQQTAVGHDDRAAYNVFSEQMPDKKPHFIQFKQNARERIMLSGEFTVPDRAYFVMGDNRDNSQDSRFWGFVPEENLVGKALFIWLNRDCVTGKGFCRRIGSGIY